jgi:hypothetical protein
MRIVAGALLVICWFAGASPALAYKWYITEDAKALHAHSFEMPYYIDAGHLDFLESPREYQIIQEAMGVWNALESPFEFVFVDHVSPAEAAFYGDPDIDQNHIVFVKNGWSEMVPFQHENAIALTRLSFNKGNAEIVDADMLINNQLYNFADCDDAPDDFLDYQDLFYVVMHEAGHMVGLDHSGDDLSVMFVQHSTCADEPLHHLTPDDKEGFLSFYGTMEYIDLATPPEPGPEYVEGAEGFEEVVEGVDGEGGSDLTDGGASPDCCCQMGGQPSFSWGAILLLLGTVLALVRRRVR